MKIRRSLALACLKVAQFNDALAEGLLTQAIKVEPHIDGTRDLYQWQTASHEVYAKRRARARRWRRRALLMMGHD